MNYHINLINKSKRYSEMEKVWGYIRRVTLVLGIIAVVAHLLVFFFYQNKLKTYRQSLSQKEDIIRHLISAKNSELKAVQFSKKTEILKSAMAKDVNFVPYYKKISTALIGNADANIDIININSAHQVDLVVTIGSDLGLLQFLSNLEDSRTLEIFNRLSIRNFDFSNNAGKNYKLSLSGEVKPIADLDIL